MVRARPFAELKVSHTSDDAEEQDAITNMAFSKERLHHLRLGAFVGEWYWRQAN